MTYDPTLSTDKDWVRFLIGDRGTSTGVGTTITGARFSDEEILAVVAAEPNKWLAAAQCGDRIVAAGAGAVAKAVGDLKLEWSDASDSPYMRALDRLRERGARELLSTTGAHSLRVL
jgi:hypothetical protein